MLVLAVLTILIAHRPDADPEIIALTVVEIRRLLDAAVLAVTHIRRAGLTLHWVDLVTIIQARARRAHFKHGQTK
ncbi:hypothetical protein [Micromonospora sp. bgisy143]|uniref:hypothetical protein n=1 Tax=Micromonospora sp. bgisy143 TaxID=3413790 RepID=UPI003EBE0527